MNEEKLKLLLKDMAAAVYNLEEAFGRLSNRVEETNSIIGALSERLEVVSATVNEETSLDGKPRPVAYDPKNDFAFIRIGRRGS